MFRRFHILEPDKRVQFAEPLCRWVSPFGIYYMLVVTLFQLYLALESNQYQRRCDWKSLHCLFCIDAQQETIHVQQHVMVIVTNINNMIIVLRNWHCFIYWFTMLYLSLFIFPNASRRIAKQHPKMIHLMMIKNFKCFLEISPQKRWFSWDFPPKKCFFPMVFHGGFPMAYPHPMAYTLVGLVPRRSWSRWMTSVGSCEVLGMTWRNLGFFRFRWWFRSRWWFQTLFIFTPTWGNDPIWLIFIKWVETTNWNYPPGPRMAGSSPPGCLYHF